MGVTATAICLLQALSTCLAAGAPSKPHIVFILQDDLGHHDTGVYGNAKAEANTGNMTALARSGIVLNKHHVHWHCSPTRRSFLTGRLPLHHTEKLSGADTDDIDLRWSWITDKLKTAGYTSYWFGKGHTGYKSMNHLPSRHGFDDGSVLFLGGAGSYTRMPHWSGEKPWPVNETYSTDLFGSLAVQAVTDHDPSVPLFLYLPFQAVHTPYDLPPDSEGCTDRIGCMIRDADRWIGELVGALRAKGMYDDTLIVYSADNGGVDIGNNYPLRGEKHTSWQGAFQVTAFVSGGFLPESVRGTQNSVLMHVVDWYPTFCRLAGVDASDDPPVAPLPVDPAKPDQDIYQGGRSFPPLDGHDVWDQLVGGNATSPHASMWLSTEVLVRGKFKLVVAQPSPKAMAQHFVNNGWKSPSGQWIKADDSEWPCNAYKHRSNFTPCLFDLEADPREQKDLAPSMRELVQDMWAELNSTNLGRFSSRSPDHLVGVCDAACAKKKWSAIAPGPGPICGVPGCASEEAESIVVV